MPGSFFSSARWRLADLIDLETLLSQGDEVVDAGDRRRFAEDIAPRIKPLAEARRRRQGLRLWLEARRTRDTREWPGQGWQSAMGLARWTLLIVPALFGAALVWGLCLGNAQRVHVVVFLGLTLVLPWLGFIVMQIVRLVRLGRSRSPWIIRVLLAPMARRMPGITDRWRAALTDTGAARRAATARAGALSQWAGLGYVLGAVAAFVVALLLFDVRFYWEATPDDDLLVHGVVSFLSTPWAHLWPAAVPGPEAIQASRLSGGAALRPPGGAVAGVWWRFLLMTLVVWNMLPRAILLGWFVIRERMALAGLDFQAPRHRTLWRALAGVSRGAVADAQTDDALVLDVGGHGISGADIRGFMLRRLRLNPARQGRLSVLDEDDEQDADTALAAGPRHVVLLVADWLLSPRQTGRLHARVREAVGPGVPVIWVVLADRDGLPGPPDADHMSRWTTFIDSLRDPATEIVAYDPGA